MWWLTSSSRAAENCPWAVGVRGQIGQKVRPVDDPEELRRPGVVPAPAATDRVTSESRTIPRLHLSIYGAAAGGASWRKGGSLTADRS